MERRRVIPVILHPCGWLRTPLSVLQGVPRDNRAISLWSNEHAAFDHVVSEITKVVTISGAEEPPNPGPLPLTPTLSRREREIAPKLL